MNHDFSIISDPASTKEHLLRALANLKTLDESSLFWVKIANNDKYNEDHRRRAIFMLFKRHVKTGINLQKLSEILSSPLWLNDKNVSLVQILAGAIPVEFNTHDSVILLSVFPDLPEGRQKYWAIFLRIEGKITAEEFYKIISSNGKEGDKEFKKRKLLEFGLSPDTPEISHE